MDYFVIASGPSLAVSDVDFVRQWRLAAPSRRVIAVNLSYRIAPWADLLYAGDAGWWSKYGDLAQREFEGQWWTASPSAARMRGLNLLQTPILSNSGANAIVLARRLYARRISLLGFDYGPGPGGWLHWHPDHPEPLFNTGRFETPEIERLARELEHAGVSVVNYSRQTALRCFERKPLEALDVAVSQPRPFDMLDAPTLSA